MLLLVFLYIYKLLYLYIFTMHLIWIHRNLSPFQVNFFQPDPVTVSLWLVNLPLPNVTPPPPRWMKTVSPNGPPASAAKNDGNTKPKPKPVAVPHLLRRLERPSGPGDPKIEICGFQTVFFLQKMSRFDWILGCFNFVALKNGGESLCFFLAKSDVTLLEFG